MTKQMELNEIMVEYNLGNKKLANDLIQFEKSKCLVRLGLLKKLQEKIDTMETVLNALTKTKSLSTEHLMTLLKFYEEKLYYHLDKMKKEGLVFEPVKGMWQLI